MYKNINGKNIKIESYSHPTISNYHLMSDEVLMADGWINGEIPVNPIVYREQVRNQLEIESKPSSFAFECEIGGEVLSFNISDSDRIDVLGQLAMGQTDIEIHDIERKKSSYTTEEATIVMVTLATVTRTYKYPYDAKIKALYELADGFTVEDVDSIVEG